MAALKPYDRYLEEPSARRHSAAAAAFLPLSACRLSACRLPTISCSTLGATPSESD